jgi:nicotinamidase-related amidase
MAITTLDARTALVLIDLQAGIVAMQTAHPAGEVVRRAAALAEAFRARGLPVVLVHVEGVAPGRSEESLRISSFPPGWTEFVPELGRQPGDIVVSKRTWGAFTGTDLEAKLRGAGVTQIVVAGIATSAGVESTARHAHELGFHVTLAVDAMTDRSEEAHAHSVTRIFPRIGETGTTEEIIGLLARS